jgi:hypothetical protein
MKIAYLILAHNTPNHISRLIRALDSPHARFFIHVDLKSDIASFEGLSRHNVTVLETRIPVYWGEFSVVQATMNLIRAALREDDEPRYLCLLSASDYPLRNVSYIEGFFARQQGREFINLIRMPNQSVDKLLDRLDHYRLQTPWNSSFVIHAVARLNDVNMRLLHFRRDYRKALGTLVPFAGSQWWALSAGACRYIQRFVETNPDFVKFFNNVYVPDEMFFQTILGNSEFRHDVVRNVTFTDWSRPEGGAAIIDMDHLSAFAKTDRVVGDDPYGRGELLFARKFPDDSATLTEFVDENLLHRATLK